MNARHYSNTIDLDNLNTSHSLGILSVPPGSRVLDLGAADGSVARVLSERGCRVWAVECEPQAAAEAARVSERITVGDLEDPATWQAIGDERFDAVLALDVLEHLKAPLPVLTRAVARLAPEGVLVVSVPNITHAAVRIALLRGRFQYTDHGLLDRTHLRFFDRPGAERLIAEAGLEIVNRLRVRRAVNETEVEVQADELPLTLREELLADPDATTYQFVFVTRPRGQLRSRDLAGMLPERLQRENDRLRETLAEAEGYARNLETQVEQVKAESAALSARPPAAEWERRLAALDAQIAAERARSEAERIALDGRVQTEANHRQSAEAERDELRAELERRMIEIERRHTELRHARADLAVREAFIHQLREDNARVEHELAALQTYAGSAGFRITESLIVRVKRIPWLHRVLRATVRKIAPRR